MRHEGIARSAWSLNLIAGAVMLFACALVRPRRREPSGERFPIALGVMGIAILGATFVDAGIDGVHRWIHVGPLALYGGPIALPLVIIAAGALLLNVGKFARLGVLLTATTAALLLFQPDAAQASGLAFASIMLATLSPKRDPMLGAGTALVIVLAAWSWFRHDPLLPVAHVEGILGLASRAGWPWLAASVMSLALLPLPFFIGASSATSRALGVYIVACIIVPLVRNYPFPLLGFGLSPIIGYGIALGTVLRSSEPDAPN